MGNKEKKIKNTEWEISGPIDKRIPEMMEEILGPPAFKCKGELTPADHEFLKKN